jgi:hypothetical protein
MNWTTSSPREDGITDRAAMIVVRIVDRPPGGRIPKVTEISRVTLGKQHIKSTILDSCNLNSQMVVNIGILIPDGIMLPQTIRYLLFVENRCSWCSREDSQETIIVSNVVGVLNIDFICVTNGGFQVPWSEVLDTLNSEVPVSSPLLQHTVRNTYFTPILELRCTQNGSTSIDAFTVRGLSNSATESNVFVMRTRASHLTVIDVHNYGTMLNIRNFKGKMLTSCYRSDVDLVHVTESVESIGSNNRGMQMTSTRVSKSDGINMSSQTYCEGILDRATTLSRSRG